MSSTSQTISADSILTPILQQPQTYWPQQLNEALSQHSEHAELAYRSAVILEQLGEHQHSIQAYFKATELAPANYLVWLYLGCLLERINNTEMALICYSKCESLTGQFKQLQLPNTMAAQTVQRFQQAWQCLERNLANANTAKPARWMQYSSQATGSAQSPHLFYVSEITARPLWQPQTFSWYAAFNKQIPDIIAEFKRSFHRSSEHLNPYLDGEQYRSAFPELANSDNWQALSLFKDGKEDAAVTKHFPILTEALQHVPCYSLGQQPYEVFFSKLAAGKTITPHYGLSNHSLTVHLAIDIPDACYLEVNGEKVAWHPGELTIFDDSFLHQAHNGSDRERIVLIFSIWHPELSNEDKQKIQQEFKQRQQWLHNRNDCFRQFKEKSQKPLPSSQ